MAGLLDFLFQGQSGGGLLGGIGNGNMNLPDAFGGNQGMTLAGLGLASGATPGEGFKNMMPAMQNAYEQQQAQRAGMALLGALPGGNQPPQQPSSLGAIGPGASYAAPSGAAPVSAPPQYQPMIAQAAQKYGIPEDVLTRQLKQESGFNPNAVSPAGATGIAQFMPGTAKDMGVDPRDPAASIDAGARYLAQNRDKFGSDLTKGLAAYNWGPGNVEKWSAAGADFNNLPRETQNYLTKVMGPAANTQQPPPGSPMTNQPGSGLQLIDSPALQGMPDTVRRALPLMFASKQYAPQAMALIQKYINPDQWQMWRDNMGNVFTRNTATGESKPLLTPTPDMMNANASGMRSPLEYQTATKFGEAAAKNTELTPAQKDATASGGLNPLNYSVAQHFGQVAAQNTGLTTEQKNAAASGGLTPAQYETQKAQDADLAKAWAKKYETSIDAGSSAQSMLPQLQMVKQVIKNDPNFYSGIGEQYDLTLKKIGAAVGISPDAPVSQEIVGKVLAAQVTAGLKSTFGGAGLGPVRVVEFNQLKESLASKTNSPQALMALVTMSERTQQRAAAVADIAQNYNNGSGRLDAGFDRAVAQYDREHPVLSKDEIDNFRKIASLPSGRPRTITNPYEAEARRRGLIQ